MASLYEKLIITKEILHLQSLEEYVDEGRIKALGVSNFNISQIERVHAIAKHPISNCQVELHLYLQQKPLVEFCKKNNITVTAYAPLGSPGAPFVRLEWHGWF